MKLDYRFGSVLLLLPALVVLSACARTGVMQGRMDGQAIQLHYHRPSFHIFNGTISTVLPDGEKFTGRYILGQTSSMGLGLGTKSGAPSVLTMDGSTSQATAVLMGNQGDSMHCAFQLAHPDSGLKGGGVGYCKLSTGQVINATFK